MRTETRRLRRSLLLPAALTICLSGTLAACSDDSDSSDPGDAASNESAGSTEGSTDGSTGAGEGGEASEEPGIPQLSGCRTSVDVTGDAEASWEGEGEVRVRTDGPGDSTARYSATDGDNVVTVYSADADIPYPAVTFSQGDQSFTTDEADGDLIEVDRSGRRASADLSLRGFENASIDLVVSFTCGKPDDAGAKRKNKKNADN